MKKYFFPIILSAIVFACSAPVDKDKKETTKVEPEETIQDSDLLAEYTTFVSKLDSADAVSSTLAAEKYKELFSKSEADLCDEAFLTFHHFYETILLRNLNDAVYKDEVLQNTFWSQEDENGKEQPMPKPFQKLEDKVAKHGYRLEFPEGMICLGLDRSFITKNFYAFVSPEMKQFLKQLDHDNNYTFAEDGGIIIAEKEFVERLVSWENFEKEQPDFILKDRVVATRQQLFAYFLEGMSNTPSYYMNDEDQSIEVQPYFKTCYEMLQKRYPNSDAWKRTKPYWKTLTENKQDGAEKMLKDYMKKGWIADFSKEQEYYL